MVNAMRLHRECIAITQQVVCQCVVKVVKMVKKGNIKYEALGVNVEYSSFGAEYREFHAMLHVEARDEMFPEQLARLRQAEQQFLTMPDVHQAKVVFKRYFLSDIINQAPLLGESDADYSVSMIQQPPLDGSKLAVWIYMTEAESVEKADGFTVVRQGDMAFYWRMGMMSDAEDSYSQTEAMLTDYEEALQRHGMNMTDNCLRTWFFTRDVDMQYMGMVKARREFFERHGMTPDTHYIASTGICGMPEPRQAIHMLDTVAVKQEGTSTCAPRRIKYLSALTHLNPTHEYGVTFERGTMLSLKDRDMIYISGTASIDNKGQVVHVGDIRRQVLRMWENVEALLKDASAGMDDIAQIIVYLRDTADYPVVKKMFQERFPDIPYVITLAPVCRPQWLVEMECIAMK